MTEIDFISMGQLAYDTYCKVRDNKSFDGKELPKWDGVDPGIRLSLIHI